jgi:MFS family permease
MPRKRSFVADLMVVLRGHDFRKLFAVRLSSQTADGAFQVGLASLIFFSTDRATTPEAVALAAVVTILPYTLVGPFAGVLLDVWPRRQVLLWANAVRSVLVVACAALVYTNHVGLPLYALVLLCLSVNRFFLAGLGAVLPKVVPPHELVMANAVSPTCGTVAALLGAGIAYGLRTLLGGADRENGILLLVAAFGYALSSTLVLRIRPDQLGPDERAPLSWASFASVGRDVGRDLVLGARHVWERRPAANALALIGGHRIGYGVMTISLALVCRNYLADSADAGAGLSLLARALGLLALGIAAAAFVTPVVTARIPPWRWIVVCIGIAAATQLLLAVRLNLPTLLLGAFLTGLTGQGAKICVDSIIQQSVDDGFRGRVFSFYDTVFNAAFVGSAGLSVLVLPADGHAPLVYCAVAVLYALAALGYFVAEKRLVRSGTGTGSAVDLEDEAALPT